MPENPTEGQKDVGQFNAWLRNIGPAKAAQRQVGQPGPAAGAPRMAPRAPVPEGGGILGDIDSDVDDVFGRIMSDGPAAPAPAAAAPAAPAAPRPAPVQHSAPMAAPQFPQPAPQPSKAPPSRADVDRIIAAAQAQQRPQPATPPPPRPIMPAQAQPAAQPQSIFGRPIAPAAPPQRPAQPAAPAVPHFEMPLQQPAAAAPHAAGDATQLAQLQLQHQQELARVENSFLETKNQLQKQVKDIQLKYQEQRTKWENVLADLRIRNDELLRRNQELEQQVDQMTERHHQLLQEYTAMRGGESAAGVAAPPEPAPLPEQMGVPQGELMKGEFVIPAVESPVPAGGIAIEAPLPETAQPQPERSFDISVPQPSPARIAQETSFQIPGEPPAEPPTQAEADDLLAELDALEKEMKDIGGK